jgi:hypothetical protein
MKILIICLAALLAGCSVGVVVTNAPASLGSCMPEKPSGGCP